MLIQYGEGFIMENQKIKIMEKRPTNALHSRHTNFDLRAC